MTRTNGESEIKDLATTEVFKLSDELVSAMAALRPVSATFKGVPGHDDAWDDFSPAGQARVADVLRGFQARLRAIPAPQNRWERLAWLVTDDSIRMDLEVIDEADPLLDMNSIQSSFQLMRMVFDCMDTSTAAGWENVTRRLETLDRAAASFRSALEHGLASGRVVAARQAAAALEQARAYAGDSSWFRTLPGSLARSGLGDAALIARLEKAAPAACGVFAGLADYIEQTYLPRAPSVDGVGRDRYLSHARRFLGMDIDPLETYAWGFEEVRTILAQMKEAAAEILPGASLPEVIHFLKTDPSRCADNPEHLIRIVRERQAQALSDLDGKHFEIPASIREVDVRRTPPGGPLGAYYIVPSEDFSRRGTIWYSFDEDREVPLYDQISTAYHEGFPGHHLQCGIQVSLTDRLSRLHRLSEGYAGYAEGWALYAEQLMHELGYFEKPDYVLGMLAAQMMRACRIVIDIGSHLSLPIPKDSPFHPGEAWTFETALEMITDVAFLHPSHAASEVTRYLGWPGQAISYKVGQRVMLELRAEEKRRRGPAFNLKDFHATVVGSGSVGLALLRELMLAG